MAVAYRSFLSVDQGQSLVDTVIEHVGRWAAAKAATIPTASPGRYTLGHNDIITVLTENSDGAHVYRWSRLHPSAHAPSDIKRATITAVEYADKAGWLWTELVPPAVTDRAHPWPAGFMCVPGFLRSLIGALSCYDGRTPAAAEPQWVSSSHLPDLMDYLADETRRGAVFVASHEVSSPEALETWALQASWELVGLGTMFLLEPAAEPAFNEMVGMAHAVRPGTVRTYAPNVTLDDPADPQRHPTLSRPKIESSHARRIAHILGMAQRDHAARAPLPEYVNEIDALLAEKERLAEDMPAPARPIPEQHGAPSHNGWSPWPQAPHSAQDLQTENARLRELLDQHTGGSTHNPDDYEAAMITAIQNLFDQWMMHRLARVSRPATNGHVDSGLSPGAG
ncbi:hypothetical protein [Phytoactinopolyspora endophytica]|uniref:hypothetical protein n=1 Tax=Phytoactinopolyspora endophytica TaxID=1642495 RepID=UPI00101D433A|nr:hypothetical protein [Phytoactinopolyspora endophytica]